MKKDQMKRMTAAVCVGALLAAAQPAYAGDGNTLDRARVNQKVKFLEEVIDEYYLFDRDARQMEEGIYTGLLYGLGDVYSEYYTPEEYARLIEETTGEYCGIGAEVQQDLQSGTITLTDVYAHGPAGMAGLQNGDQLIAVDHESTKGKLLTDVVNDEVKGPEGSMVSVTIYRPATKETLTKEIKRAQVMTVTVNSYMLEDGIGYIQIKSFDELTAGQFKDAVWRLQSQGMTRLIIDLRNNPGGTLDSAVDILAYLLPPGQIVYTKDKNGQGQTMQTKDGHVVLSDYPDREPGYHVLVQPDEHELDMPMVVLVNGQSASAAELVTSALKDYHWAAVVGEKTYGKGIMQSVIPLNDGSAIKLTTAHYYTKSGYEIHENGITPDITIAPDPQSSTDVQLEKAIEVVKGR